MSKWASIGIRLRGGLDPSVGKTFDAIGRKGKDLQQELGKLRLGKRLTDDVVKYQAMLKRLKAAQDRLGPSNVKLTRRIAEIHERYLKAERSAAKYGIRLRDLAGEQDRYSRAVARSERAIARQEAQARRRGVRREARGQILGLAATGLALAQPVRKAVEFESAMADVRKVVNFETPQQFKEMGRDILALSKRMPMAASGIADIVAAAGQSGIARQDLLEFAEAAAKMGVAFDLTGSEAGQMMANWRAGMKLTQPEVVGLADAVNHLSNNMNAQAPALGEVLQRMGPLAKSSGLAVSETAALAAALLSTGARAEVAGTGLKNFLGALTKGTAATKSQTEAFDALGLDAVEMAERMQSDAKGAILEVLAAIKELDAAEQPAVISELFGEESKAAIMPLLANMENLTQAFDLVAEKSRYAGSMEAEYTERAKTTANELQLLANKATAAGVTMGGVFLPALRDVVGFLGRGAEAVAGFAEKHPELTKVVGFAAAGLFSLKVATLGVKFGLSGIMDAAGLARSGLGLVATGFNVLKAAVMAHPVGAIIAGVALAAGLIIANWDKVKGFFLTIWEPIKPYWEKFAEWTSALADKLLAPFRAVGQAWDWMKRKTGFGGGEGDEAAPGLNLEAFKPLMPAAPPGKDGAKALPAIKPAQAAAPAPAPAAAPAPASRPVQVLLTQNISLSGGADENLTRSLAAQAGGEFKEAVAKAMTEIMQDDRRLSYGY